MGKKLSRRKFMGKSLGVSAAAMTGLALEEKTLMAQLVNREGYGEKQEPVRAPVQDRRCRRSPRQQPHHRLPLPAELNTPT